ncbi:MAG TPA: polymer-forming cytoskeletal family protein [Spirochaetes bacterium]|nr:polymer-forming cytoskeletal family protein [Spirochaetota bacterium]
MMRKSDYSDIKEGEKVETIFSNATMFNGELTFKTSLKIEGSFKGKIKSKGHLIVGENAKIRASIKAHSIVIAGEVKGNVEAVERLELLPTGKLYGNIKTKKLKMADGVIFEGSCEMLKEQGLNRDIDVASRSKDSAAFKGDAEEIVRTT